MVYPYTFTIWETIRHYIFYHLFDMLYERGFS